MVAGEEQAELDLIRVGILPGKYQERDRGEDGFIIMKQGSDSAGGCGNLNWVRRGQAQVGEGE